MEDDTEYLKLPVEDRCVHKNWKGRVSGYEEAKKLFNQITDEKSPEWNKFLGLLKKMVVDSNAAAQEKGLEAVLLFVENCAFAGKTVGEVMSGLVAKCVGAPKAKTKDLAAQISLMFIEIEKHEITIEELLKGTEQKNPKIVSGCVNIMTQAIREFGIKVINIKPLVKRLSGLLEDRDKNVRDETKALTVEVYRWIGVALNAQLTALKPVQITELEAEFAKVKGDKALPTRYLRSQQAKQAKIAAEIGVAEEDDGEDECDDVGGGDVDPYELMVPVDILSRMPKDWQDKVEAKKWQERKEVLDALDQMLQTGPKLENGDYGDLVRVLKKMVTKDSNVVVVALAAKCLAGIANGLKKRFQPYSAACIGALLEKFREKKQTVVIALREAIDVMFVSATLEAIQEDVLTSLENKNPSVKAETAAFLARCFTKCTPVILNKKLLKVFVAALLKTLNESDPTVREASADALGTAMKVVGEKGISPFLTDVDNLKLAKIKEACEKAELQVKQPKTVTKKAPVEHPLNPKPSAGSTAPKPVKRPNSAAAKKPAPTNTAKKLSGSTSNLNAKSKSAVEREMSADEVDEKAEAIFPPNLLTGLADSNWKTRFASMEQFQQMLADLDQSEVSSQLLLRVVNKKPGLKDTNFQVAKLRLGAVKTIAETFPVSMAGMLCVVTDVTEKMSDSKTQGAAADALTALSEATKVDQVATQVLDYAFTQKNPKVQVEVFNWLSNGVKELGFVIQPKLIMDNVKKGVAATNPLVRTAAITFVGVLSIYMGHQVMSYFEGEKPALLQFISAECDKHAGDRQEIMLDEVPEKPVVKSKSSSSIPDKGKPNSKMGPGSTATFTKSKSKPAATAGAKPAGRGKKDAELDTAPLLQLNSLKNQRVIDEQKLKTLKWNFTTPREEFVELLKDQMTTAGINRELMTNMFHSDFKYHLKAIDSLSEDLGANADAQTANLDLILRWLTLRFFDTNPSVLLKGLEYLQSLFAILIDNHYSMLENEACSFLPYLILKIGDPKDTVRNNVRALLKQIWSVYPISKLFIFLMEGIKSKNARQRTECLEHTGLLMETFGIGVCQPTPSAALKEIAKQISDRDNSVRTAALNCIVTAYFLDGEKVLKMVGQISDKDMSLLEERIKRAAKNRPVASVKPLPQVGIPRMSVAPMAPAPTPTPVYDEPESEEEALPSPPPLVINSTTLSCASQEDDSTHHEIPDVVDNISSPHMTGDVPEDNTSETSYSEIDKPRPVRGPFGLDQAFIESIETEPVKTSQPKLIEFDLDFLKEPSTHINLTRKLDSSLSMSSLSKMSSSMTLEWHLAQIGNRDIDRALEGMHHIDSLLTSDHQQQLQAHEDLLVAQLVRNLEFLNQSNSPEVVNCYKRNLGLLVKFFGNYPMLSVRVKENTLQEAIKILLILLTEKRLEMLDPGTDMFVRVVNNVVIRILDQSDHTTIICALVKNLYDTVNNPGVSAHYQELLMKCIWKLIKFLDDWENDLHYDAIFVDIHTFLRDYPSSWWKKQPSDTPLRTIKTIMHTIVKLNGPPIGEIVKNVKGVTPESELWTYVQKLLKHIKVVGEEAHVAPSVGKHSETREVKHTSTTSRLCKATHNQLSEIFTKIGRKEESNEGLQLLYDFKKQHPDADLSPYLKKSSEFFRDYIERGLKNIEKERQMAGELDFKTEVEVDNDSKQYLQKLRAWQVKAGWNNVAPATATRPTPPQVSTPVDTEPLPARQSLLDTSLDTSVMADETEVEALRRRLEKVGRTALR